MAHRWLASVALLITVSLSGCMGIQTVGTGCVDSCGQCDGCGPRPIPCNPREGMRQIGRSIVCSGGCGEVYYGEWISSPPDCEDPCDPCQQWTGGCGEKCLPCVRLHSFLSCLAGKRLRCDYSRDVFDICSICRQEYCDPGCDTCPSCCEGESYEDGSSIMSGDGAWSEQYEGSSSGSTPYAPGSQFKPMPRARLASSTTNGFNTQTKAPCNCGKHAP